MTTRLLIFALLFSFSFAYSQTTYIPDDNFENYLETHDFNGNAVPMGDPTSMGNGIANDDYVTTAAISAITQLDVSNQNISDLTGIEGFTALTKLFCYQNQLTQLNVSQNIALVYLQCDNNQLSSIDVSANINLGILSCSSNQLTQLNLTKNLNLISLFVRDNQLSHLDLHLNTNLQGLHAGDNRLETINYKTGNNTNWSQFNTKNNPNLKCIEVDDPVWSAANWTDIDLHTGFNANCSNTNQDAFEPNQSFSQYVSVALCSIINPTIGAPGDVDFFRVALEQNVSTKVELEVPTGLTYKVTFFNDDKVQIGSELFVTHTQSLTHFLQEPENSNFYLKIESANANYSVSPYKLTVSNQNCTLGVSEFMNNTLNFFPNPVKEQLTISVPIMATYYLVSVNGQLIKQGQLQIGNNMLNVSGLADGLFFLRVETAQGILTKKIIKH